MSRLNNFLEDILEAADDEPIIAVNLGEPLDRKYDYNTNKHDLDPRDLPLVPFHNRISTWEEIFSYLSYEYDAGYGSMDCHNIVFWTETRVFYIHEYDGSTYIDFQFRNPT